MKKLSYAFNGLVFKGKLTLDAPHRFTALIPTFEGKKVRVYVELLKKKRSNPQNRYYWGVVVRIAGDHIGYFPEEMHEAWKMLFLRKHAEGKPDTVKSTTVLSTVEFGEYIERCRQWCAEQGIVIPDPESVSLENITDLEIDPKYLRN